MAGTKRLPLEVLKAYLLEVPPPWNAKETAVLSWANIFGNDRPVEIEVGFGKGLFLLSASQARPETNFFGIEIERKYVLFTANRLAKRQIANVRLTATDARYFLRGYVADRSVQAVHVFFPDPWWKNRHRKRRLLDADFAEQCARVLQPDGKLFLVTDVADYFAESMAMLDRVKGLRRLAEADLPIQGGDYLTNFERKYRQEGRPIHRAVFAK